MSLDDPDDEAALLAEVRSIVAADMKTALADLMGRDVDLTPDVLDRIEKACAESVMSLMPGCDVEVDAARGEVRAMPRRRGDAL